MTTEFFKKLHLQPSDNILVLNAPEGYAQAMATHAQVTPDVQVKKGTRYDMVHLFVANQSELAEWFLMAENALKKDAIFWISYPKISSGQSTDLNRDRGWDLLIRHNWYGVAQISLDDTWSCLRFRETAQVKKKPDPRTRTARVEVVKQTKTITRGLQVPPDLSSALENIPEAMGIFNKLAYTHRKEYVNWILDAKKEETRNKRIAKAVEMIAKGRKMS